MRTISALLLWGAVCSAAIGKTSTLLLADADKEFPAPRTSRLEAARTKEEQLSAAPPLGTYLHLSWDKTPAALYRVLNALGDLGYDFIFLEVGGNLRLDRVPGLEGQGQWSPTEIQQFIRTANARGIHVYPVVSLFSHPECGPRQARYVDPQFGLRLWEEGVYDFVQQVVLETLKVFRAGQPGRMYFHVRLDEAADAVGINARRLGKTPEDVFADHVLQLHRIITAAGAQMVMYHDMLLSPEDVSIGTALGGPPLNTARALDRLPRDIIINFWLYDFMPGHAPAIEHFTQRGFPVWVSPWLAPEIGLAQYAHAHHLPLVGTTWCSVNRLGRYYGHQRALFTTAHYLRHPATPPSCDPRLQVVRRLNAPPQPLSGISLRLPALRPSQRKALQQSLQGFPGGLPQRALCFLDQPDPGQTWEQRVLTAPKPLSITWSEGRRQELAGINIERGEGEFVLYTPSYGPRTNTNAFGGEIVLIEGRNRTHSPGGYGLGDHPLPPGGCVLSAHCGAWTTPAMLEEMTHHQLSLVDAVGRSLLPEPASEELQEQRKISLELPPARRVILVQGSVNAAMPGRVLGEVRLVGANSEVRASSIIYGQNIAAFKLPEWLMTPDLQPVNDAWLAWSDDQDGPPRAVVATNLRLPENWQPQHLEFVPTTAGRQAGWTVLAVKLSD